MKERELKEVINRIEISGKARVRILEKIKKTDYGKEHCFMKSKKRLAIAAVAATFILGATAFALNNMTFVRSTSKSTPDYTSLPSDKQLEKDIGYSGDMIETFSNGYSFDNGRIKHNVLQSGDDDVEKFESLTLCYSKGDNRVDLYMDKRASGTEQTETGAKLIAENGGIAIYEHSFTHKIVPEDYVKSEDEIAAEKRGELMFAYDGEDHIVETSIKSVLWTKDDIQYSFMQFDGELSAAELADMANELIEKG